MYLSLRGSKSPIITTRYDEGSNIFAAVNRCIRYNNNNAVAGPVASVEEESVLNRLRK